MNKHRFEEAGMRYAPVEVAKYFGHEHPVPEVLDVDAPFVFHNGGEEMSNTPGLKIPGPGDGCALRI